MAFCQKCGTEITASAAFCGGCGTRVDASGTGQAAEVSETWKKRFAIIEKGGGPKLPKYRELERKERHEIAFNVWAAFLGPFYYLAKGMWKKALVLTPLVIITVLVIEYLLSLVFSDPTMGKALASFAGSFGIWGPRANKDYYRKIVLKDNGWW